MPKDTPKLLNVEKNYSTKFLNFYTAKYEAGGKEHSYFFTSRNELNELAISSDKIKPTAIEAFTYIKEDGVWKILMIKEFRRVLNRYFVSFPAGLIELSEEPEKAFKREIFEELGGEVKNIELCQNYPLALCVGLTDEANYFALVEISKLGEQHLEELERIEVIKYTVEELEQHLKDNDLPLTLSGYLGATLLINKLKNN